MTIIYLYWRFFEGEWMFFGFFGGMLVGIGLEKDHINFRLNFYGLFFFLPSIVTSPKINL